MSPSSVISPNWTSIAMSGVFDIAVILCIAFLGTTKESPAETLNTLSANMTSPKPSTIDHASDL